MTPDFKQGKRIKDPKLFKQLHEAGLQCVLCAKKANAHHVLPKGSPYFGDDVYENIIGLCGSGTTGHHGLYHAGDLDTRNDIGSWLLAERPDIINYVHTKLGSEAGSDWLHRKLLL